MVEISTSVLSVEKEKAVQTFYNLEVAHTDYFHIDVMDGNFVEQDTTQKMREYAETIKQISNIPLDVHLMVQDVHSYVQIYSAIEPSIITFHLEALEGEKEIIHMIEEIKEKQIKVGISLKPNTPVEKIYPFLPYLHVCLVMTVEPGYGGQQLIPETIQKIKKLKEYIEKNNLDTYLQADGGINLQTAELVRQAGCDILVAGSAIIGSESYQTTIQQLKQ